MVILYTFEISKNEFYKKYYNNVVELFIIAYYTVFFTDFTGETSNNNKNLN